jgi:hypothetical protein
MFTFQKQKEYQDIKGRKFIYIEANNFDSHQFKDINGKNFFITPTSSKICESGNFNDFGTEIYINHKKGLKTNKGKFKYLGENLEGIKCFKKDNEVYALCDSKICTINYKNYKDWSISEVNYPTGINIFLTGE